MYSESRDNKESSAEAVMEGIPCVEELLVELESGRLAERIMEVARQAAAQELLSQAREVQSAVETEISTQ